MRFTNRKHTLCLGLTIALLTAAGSSHATRVRQVGLAEMVQAAERIFVGRCVERSVPDQSGSDIPSTTYRFEVLESVKGVDSPVVEIRVPGARGREQWVGMPQFAPGDHVLLLLYPEGANGLTAPIGLGQGKFDLHESTGGEFAVNAFGNRSLLEDVPEAVLTRHAVRKTTVAGGVPLPRLVGVLRELVQEVSHVSP